MGDIGILVAWLIGGGMGLFALDRFLLWAESRGWIYYRRRKPGRGAITYHILETSSIFNPSFQVVQEIQLREERQEDESGDPVGPDADAEDEEEQP